METLPPKENAEAFIALSIVFDRHFARESNTGDRPYSQIVGESLRSISSSRREMVNSRLADLETLTDVERQRWLGRWIDNLRRRGRSTKLDHHVGAEHILRVLKKEPAAIRNYVLNYLPVDLGRDVEKMLGRESDVTGNEGSRELPAEIIDVVKNRFLANFVQIESICDLRVVDELSVAELGEFIRLLGLREIAVACRGIRSREKIAAFLCRFAEDDAKTIATCLSKLDHVEPIWVSIADRTVQRLWNRRLRPHLITHKIGLDLLACAFAERNATAIRYTAEKLSWRDSNRWEKLISEWQEKFRNPDIGMIEIDRKRAAMINVLARTFKTLGTL